MVRKDEVLEPAKAGDVGTDAGTGAACLLFRIFCGVFRNTGMCDRDCGGTMLLTRDLGMVCYLGLEPCSRRLSNSKKHLAVKRKRRGYWTDSDSTLST